MQFITSIPSQKWEESSSQGLTKKNLNLMPNLKTHPNITQCYPVLQQVLWIFNQFAMWHELFKSNCRPSISWFGPGWNLIANYREGGSLITFALFGYAASLKLNLDCKKKKWFPWFLLDWVNDCMGMQRELNTVKDVCKNIDIFISV